MNDPNWPPPPPPPYVPPPPRPVDDAYASVAQRLSAVIADVVVMGLAFLVVILLAGAIDSASNGASKVVAVVGYLAVLLYAPLTMMRRGAHNGQTLGKQWLRIRVQRIDGEPMGFGHAFAREFIGKGIIGGLTFYIDYLWAIWDPRGQTLHDKLVQTLVVGA